MITFLTSPKPFAGVAETNQINAIRSWLRVAQDVEIILYGRSEGTIQAAQELGIRCVPDIQTNEFGTPLFGAIAAHAAIHGKHDIQCYVNCDILFSKSILNAIHSIHYEKYLLIGQRIDLSEGVSLDVTKSDYLTRLKTLAGEGTQLKNFLMIMKRCAPEHISVIKEYMHSHYFTKVTEKIYNL